MQHPFFLKSPLFRGFALFLFTCSTYLCKAQDTTLVDFKSFHLPIISMTHNGRGQIWFNTRFDLYTFDGQKIKWVKKMDDRNSLVYKDGKLQSFQAVWSKPGKIKNEPWQANKGWVNHLPNKGMNVYVAPDNYGKIWVTAGQHLFGFRIDQHFRRTLESHSIRGILEHEGNLFVNSYSGVFKNGNLFFSEDVFSNGNALAISSDEIWIASYTLVRYLFKIDTFYPMPIRAADKLGSTARVDYLHQMNQQTWAGSTEYGLLQVIGDTLASTGFKKSIEHLSSEGNILYIATTTGIFTYDGHNFSRVEQFPVRHYNSIQKIGDTWWATSTQGVWYWNAYQTSAKQLFSDLPLNGLETYCILKDSKGYFWVSSTSGLHRFKPDQNDYESYLTGIEFNKRSAANIRDTFYFGTINGLISFDPTSFPPPIVPTSPPFPRTLVLTITGLALLLGSTLFFLLKWKRTQQKLEDVQLIRAQEHVNPFMASLEQYIRANINTVNVASLSTFANLSERGLYRFLQDNYQLTPGDVIRNLKLQRIKELLAEHPGIAREELAVAVGYSVTHINRILSGEKLGE